MLVFAWILICSSFVLTVVLGYIMIRRTNRRHNQKMADLKVTQEAERIVFRAYLNHMRRQIHE